MNRKKEIAKYLVADYLTSSITWTLFWAFRKLYIESHKYGIDVPFHPDSKFYLSALLAIPAFWIFLYAMSGLYANVFHKSRIAEVKQLFTASAIGVVILFFTLLLNDAVINYKSYYMTVSLLFGLQFFLSTFFHLVITSGTNKKVHNRKIGFNTILVGSNLKAFDLYTEMEKQRKSSGNKFVGFVHVDKSNGFSAELNKKLAHLGEFEGIRQSIEEKKVEEVIVAIESSEHKYIENIINTLDDCDVSIKIIPDMYDIMTGSVRLSSIMDAPLIVVSRDILDPWQRFFKRFFDVFMSLFFLIILSPVYLIIAIVIKLTSKGPVIYSQERIGLHGRPFTIYKFRSMNTNAEKNGPALSSNNDSRITPFGKFLRRSRMDELPQFYNVLIGTMSIVGPRPERQFFIDQIVQRAHHYRHLTKVKPGITSWGQVKYGYAENIEQMIERMKYDLLYIENISLLLDLRIIIYTILIVFQGRGK
jgi:exopolysaccharide biosynthesis polyprenyl glycosylphosphotransferase